MGHERRLRALGVVRPRFVGEAGVAAEIEGTTGPWRVDPDATGEGFRGRTALLSPFDRLVHDRARTEDLFTFEHVFEMYKPAAQRRWGYFALPVVHGDRLVGKVDAAADRKASVLRVHAVHRDVPFTPEMTAGVDAELAALAGWLGLEGVARAVRRVWIRRAPSAQLDVVSRNSSSLTLVVHFWCTDGTFALRSSPPPEE